ncbi:hypothetical protein AALP_AA5G209600 [Arabis alpina]|uniref:VQ domain-containing protein n=1 Tax=Arabis alpina TaxID=50452 RepID=A0A087GYF8_ARAAL|nr:hypothetical protein AALP_AA5G209600 [Arabis alpina]
MDLSSSSSTYLTTTTSLDKSKPSQVSRKPLKQKKKTSSTSKPIKVRYISNPMRVETCASKFRELVQELTGQDAVDLEVEPEFSSPSDHNPSPAPETRVETLDGRVGSEYYEPLDNMEEEMFLPHEMSAGFSGFFSNGFYNVNDFGRIDSV